MSLELLPPGTTHYKEDNMFSEIANLRYALDRIANMKNRDGVEIDMHRDELRAIARTALRLVPYPVTTRED